MKKPNIPRDEYILCNSYVRILPNIWNVTDENKYFTPPPGLVHCCLDGIKEFFEIHGNNGNDYVLISSSSDFGLYEQAAAPVWYDFHKGARLIPPTALQDENGYIGINMAARCDVTKCCPTDKYSIKCYSWTHSTFNEIPSNIKKWFLTNCMVSDEVCEPIPFGVFSEPASVEKLASFNRSSSGDETALLYINFQDYTSERWEIKRWFMGDSIATVRLQANLSYGEFLADMSAHPLVVAPQGNGVDCFRTMESIYLGCVPLIEKSICAACYDGLPVVFVSDYRRLRREDFINMIRQMEGKVFNYERATLSYWRNKFNATKTRFIGN